MHTGFYLQLLKFILTGMVTAISNMICQSPITCKLREEKTILLHPTGSSQQMIEATFDLNLQAIKNDADPLIVPLMLAQTIISK